MKPSYQHFCDSCDCKSKKRKQIDTKPYVMATSERLKQNHIIKLFKNVKNRINQA